MSNTVSDTGPISVTAAARTIAAAMPRLPARPVPLAEACNRVLAEPVYAERDQPPFDRVMMDGIAIAHRAAAAGTRRFLTQGVQAAGAQRQLLEDTGHCIEVMTGAVLPEGCDCVVPVERVRCDGDYTELTADLGLTPGQFVHRAGSDYRRGDVLLEPGTLVGGPEMAVLASAGQSRVTVAAMPAVGIIAVGDELVDPGDTIGPAQIRRSNDYAIAAALQRAGLQPDSQRKLPDDPARLRDGIGTALGQHDVLVLTGGVSMGKYDYIPSIMSELGIEVLLHKVAQRPGKPMWVGRRGERVVFALPGNPVSALVCARRYVVPALQGAMGYTAATETVPLAHSLTPPARLTWFVPVCLSPGVSGMVAQPRLTNTSGDFHTLAGTTGFVELPAQTAPFAAGYVAPLWRW